MITLPLFDSRFDSHLSLLPKRSLNNAKTPVRYKFSEGAVITDRAGNPQQVPSAAETERHLEGLQAELNRLHKLFTSLNTEKSGVRTQVMSALAETGRLKDVLETLKSKASAPKKQVNSEVIEAKKATKEAHEVHVKSLEKGIEKAEELIKDTEKRFKELLDMAEMILSDHHRLMTEKEKDDRARQSSLGLSELAGATSRFARKGQQHKRGADDTRRLDENESRNTQSREVNNGLLERIGNELGLNVQPDSDHGRTIHMEKGKHEVLKGLLDKGPLSSLKEEKKEMMSLRNQVKDNITALSKEISQLESKQKEGSASEKERLEALKKQREILQQLEQEFAVFARLLEGVNETTTAIEKVYQETSDASSPFETLEVSAEAFDTLQKAVEMTNTEFCEAFDQMIDQFITSMQKSYQVWKADLPIRDSIRGQQQSLRDKVSKRKARKFSLTEAINNPQKTVEEFFSSSEEAPSFLEILGAFEALLNAFAQESKTLLQEDPLFDELAFDQILSGALDQLDAVREGATAEIEEQIGWFDEQVEQGTSGIESRSFSVEQEQKIRKALQELETLSVQETLFPVLEVILSEEEMEKLSSSSKATLSIDHLGIEPSQFVIEASTKLIPSKKAGEPDQEVVNYLINGKTPHLALTGGENSLFGILKYFFSSLQSGRAEREDWIFTVQA